MVATARILRVSDHLGLTRLITRVGLWRGTLILTYHRIAPAYTRPAGVGWSASADELDAQLRYLSRHVEVVGPEALGARQRARSRRVMLTFDDGYRDNFEAAFPLLKERGVPATFFIATGFVDEPRVAWWDDVAWMIARTSRDRLVGATWLADDISLRDEVARREAVNRLLARYKQLPAEDTERFLDWLAEATGTGRTPAGEATDVFMTWDMLREVVSAGMLVGGHTVTHPVLANLPPDRQRQEIAGCRDRLWTELGVKMDLFAYPVGLPATFDAVTVRWLRDAGVKLAFSYYGGYVRGDIRDRFDVPRTSVWSGMAPERFHAVLALPQRLARW